MRRVGSTSLGSVAAAMGGGGAGISDDVARLLRERLPDSDRRTIELLGEGDFCRAYLVDGRGVVRVPKHEEAARALAREACLLPRLATLLSVTIPVPEHVRARGSGGPSFSLHDHVPGVELTSERWRGLPERARVGLARQVGGFLEALHVLDVEVALSCGVEVVDHRAHAARLSRELGGAPGSHLPGSLRSALGTAFRRYAQDRRERDYAPAILHADVGPGHVLVDPEHPEVTGVIDWTDVRVGDPARDFIFLYEDWGEAFLTAALAGYGLEQPERLLPRVHLQYLLDQSEWTFQAARRGEAADVEHGVEALRNGLRDLERSSR